MKNPLKRKSEIEKTIESLVPPIKLNYNWGGGILNYRKGFTERFTKEIFPYLLQKSTELKVPTNELSILDIGCGWGPLAIAALIHERAIQKRGSGYLKYLGIDIREDAINWLKAAYTAHSFASFQLHSANSNIDYVGAVKEKSSTVGKSNGAETKFVFPSGFQHNWQWSSSVFTHLTPEACLEALKSIRKSCAVNSMQLNTWLIIDDESAYSLASGSTDRVLPFDLGDFLTYSKSNPLVCTCYKIEAIERMYRESGLEIVSIDKGSWRGPAYKNGATYQDVIISRPI